jgi:hypothetical protein
VQFGIVEKSIPNNYIISREFLTGLTTYLFPPAPKITRYRYRYRYRYEYRYMYGYRYKYRKVQRTVESMSE